MSEPEGEEILKHLSSLQTQNSKISSTLMELDIFMKLLKCSGYIWNLWQPTVIWKTRPTGSI